MLVLIVFFVGVYSTDLARKRATAETAE